MKTKGKETKINDTYNSNSNNSITNYNTEEKPSKIKTEKNLITEIYNSDLYVKKNLLSYILVKLCFSISLGASDTFIHYSINDNMTDEA